ncbi:MAG: TetR/AcrR family transcriptional regulator [Nitrospirae bacterium]|nr:TetR/AcrR family transcriptional regulator [Nitrospirota bacterium]
MGRPKIINNEQLLQHAREEFLKKGAFGSTKEIARKAGVSEATLYQRYPTKTALFLAAMVPQQVNIDAIIHSFTKETDPRRVLTEIGLRILGYFRTLIPVVMHLITNPSISMADVTAHFKTMPEQELAESLAAHMKEANSRGTIKADNPIASASLFVSALHSLAVFELMEIHGGKSMDHAVEGFVEALWSGIAPSTRKRKTASTKKGLRGRD